ncbi:MAG: S9 family peptidase [Chloroflexi bacterium]|nr:S9 family peptidase [Chloroflexota bacterium]
MTTPTPPIASVKPMEFVNHGDRRVDPYYWLRERDNPEMIAYLEAENAYTKASMAHTETLQKELFAEMKGRIKETDETVPVEKSGYFYYRRTVEGKQYPIYCRKVGALDAPEQVLLDLNVEAEGKGYMRLGNFTVSPDQRLLAYALDDNGSENFTLRVKNLETDALLPDEIAKTYYGLEWGNDNATLYYTVLDAAMRPYKLFRHRLGSDAASDELLYHEPDESYFLSLYKTKSERFVIVHLRSAVTQEVHLIDADDPAAQPRVVQPRIHRMEYGVEHHRDAAGKETLFVTTNWEAENFRVMTAPVDAPDRENWQEFIPHRPAVKVDRVEAFLDFLVVHEREAGLRQMRVQDLHSGIFHRIEQPEPAYTVGSGENPNFESRVLRYNYTSLVSPPTVFDYTMDTRRREMKKQDEVKGYNPDDYRAERVWAIAADGAQVPISLVYPKNIVLDGGNPTLLYGYGSYGASIDPSFSSSRVSLLQRGFVYAIAHVRGGGEMGRAWKEDGKFLNKKNTFTDFIAAAEHLIAAGFTQPDKLGAMGRSAGGLVMGAITNLRPDLFKAVIAGVPFVDVINTMLDPTIPLTVIEWEEWGNPAHPAFYAYMKSYSPYDNVAAKAYPAILATAGLNDPRVQYWEPAKWVALLRTRKTDDNLLLLKTNMGAGHGGASGRYDYLEETAFEYAFLLDQVM